MRKTFATKEDVVPASVVYGFIGSMALGTTIWAAAVILLLS